MRTVGATVRATAVVVVLALAGCASADVVATDDARRVVREAGVTSAAVTQPGAAVGGPAGVATGSAAVADARSAAYPPLEPGQVHRIWGSMPLEMTLEPACASAGTVMRAVVRTVPDALIGGAVRYADGDPHGDLTFGRAATGEWIWTWTVEPDVPHGLAEAHVTAGKRGETGGAIRAAFRVAARC